MAGLWVMKMQVSHLDVAEPIADGMRSPRATRAVQSISAELLIMQQVFVPSSLAK